jgi:ATP/maltotriose-dependent transcriptional regulator MalT
MRRWPSGVLRSACFARNLRLDGLGRQRARSVAQNLGELVIERPWLNQLDNAIVGQGISLLQWRVEASNTPTICRLYRFTPSPTSAHSSTGTLQKTAIAESLTAREGAILKLIAQGLSNKEMARTLVI